MTEDDPSKQSSPHYYKWIKWKQEESTKSPENKDLSSKQAHQHKRCLKAVDTALKQNPYIRFLIKKMTDLGCNVTEEFFSCRQCPRRVFGFFDTQLGVVLCENYNPSHKILQSVMVHEMIHAFDHCHAVFNKTNCYHVACSEIRATNLSGECKWTREVLRGYFAIGRQREVIHSFIF
jgi:inner membrane protease ATP23